MEREGKEKKFWTKDNLISLMAVIAFLLCIGFGLKKSYQPMWLFMIMSVAFLFFSNLDRIVKITLSKTGFTAETREVIKEAKITINELQDLAKITATLSLGLVKRTGRLGGYSYDEKEYLKKSVLQVLEQIGLSREERDKILTDSRWHDYVEFDYVYYILGGYKSNQIFTKEQLKDKKIMFPNRGLGNVLTPEELEQIFKKYDLFNDEIKEIIKDYEHYIKYRKQKRSEVWKDRENWYKLIKAKK